MGSFSNSTSCFDMDWSFSYWLVTSNMFVLMPNFRSPNHSSKIREPYKIGYESIKQILKFTVLTMFGI